LKRKIKKGEFLKKLPKNLEFEKIEVRHNSSTLAKEIESRIDISSRDAYRLATILNKNSQQELEKLENFFYERKFSFEEAEKLLLNREEVEIFKSLEALILGRRDLALKYALQSEAMPFIYAMMASLRVIIKIKILDLKSESYDNFMKVTYPKFKKVLPHPYFVFKNLKIANKFPIDKVDRLILKTIEAESSIREGLPPKVALLNLINNFS